MFPNAQRKTAVCARRWTPLRFCRTVGSTRCTRQVPLNFFAHAVVASWHSSNARFVLGAMLPDLAGMTGIRLHGASDVEVQRGIDLHHTTDAAFHTAPIFTTFCAEAIARLSGEGVERGTARAVAHVGVELTLDGVLGHDHESRELYAAALDVAISGGLAGKLSVTPAADIERLTIGLGRLARAPIPEAYADPEVVADRLRVILASRPRLAMRASDFDPVRRWALDVRPRVADRSQELLEQVRAGVRLRSR